MINNCGKASALAFNSNLLKTQDWVYQWKMLLNKTKLNKYIISCFQERLMIFIHPPLLFNNATLKLTHAQSTCHPENMRTIKSVRQQKWESFFASYNLFYHADAYWTFINLSKYLNHGINFRKITTMKMLLLTSHPMHCFQIKLNNCNTTWHCFVPKIVA